MRQTSSCSTCRSRKKKCVPLATQIICMLCSSKNLQCDLKEVQAQQQHTQRVTVNSLTSASSQSLGATPYALQQSLDNQSVSNLSTTRSDDSAACLDSSVIDELMGLYFEMIHNKQQILFHRREFLAHKRAGSVPEYIVLGIAALVARFSPNPHFRGAIPRDRGLPFLRQALQYFNARQDVISLQALQGCLLLEFDCFVEGLQDQASLLAAQAIRMTQMLDFSKNLSLEATRRETEIRLFWSTYMMDTWCSVRSHLPRQMTCNPTMRKPLSEEIFESMTDGDPFVLYSDTVSTRQSSIWANVVTLHQSYPEILELLRSLVERPAFAFETERIVQKLTFYLDNWLRNLPTELHNNRENFQAFARRGHGGDFAVLHLQYHHQNQLLYYQFLHQCASDAAEPDPQILAYIYRCKTHAEALSELMWLTNTTQGSESLWSPLNGHLLVIASTVHLHSLLFDQDFSQRKKAKTLLEQNFVLLLQLQVYWPSLKASLSRLQAFHRSCHRSDPRASFQMDSWMFEFLNDYDNPIDDRRICQADVVTSRRPEETDLPWSELYSMNATLQRDLYARLSYQ